MTVTHGTDLMPYNASIIVHLKPRLTSCKYEARPNSGLQFDVARKNPCEAGRSPPYRTSLDPINHKALPISKLGHPCSEHICSTSSRRSPGSSSDSEFARSRVSLSPTQIVHLVVAFGFSIDEDYNYGISMICRNTVLRCFL